MNLTYYTKLRTLSNKLKWHCPEQNYVLTKHCARKGRMKICYPKATLRNFRFLPIHTSPNWPAPSFFTIFTVSLGISHSSWSQGLWGAAVWQGLPSLWHKPSDVSLCTIKKFVKAARMFRGEYVKNSGARLQSTNLTEMKPCLLVLILSGVKHDMCPNQNAEKVFHYL